jgi:hypothetical protein
MSSIRLTETFLHGLSAESEMQFEIGEHGLRLAEVPVYVRYDDRARRSPIKHGFGVLYRVGALTVQRRQSGRRGLGESWRSVGRSNVAPGGAGDGE